MALNMAKYTHAGQTLANAAKFAVLPMFKAEGKANDRKLVIEQMVGMR
jgi:protein involved in ribonucleotide reduction